MPSFTPLMPGDPGRLAGLKLLGRLGEGGQGVVYLAETPMGAHVAVKWLRLDQSDDEKSVERFLREARIAQQVARFCTAAVLSTGVEHDRPYIMSEFVEGPSLARVVRNEGPRTGSALDWLAINTASALAAIHAAGVVHRDFKPANVIIAADGPRVIDFGIARELGPATMTSSTQIGTPAYMSPEQVLGHAVGPAADMFSWAGTMVFASCGRAPFGNDVPHAVWARVLNNDPRLGSLDGPLLDVVRECLAKDPAQRPTAREVIMRLLRNPSTGSDQDATWNPPAPDPPEEQGFSGTTWNPPPDQDIPEERGEQAAPRSARKPIIIGAAVLAAVLLFVSGMVAAVALSKRTPTAGGSTAATSKKPAQTPPPSTPAEPVKTTLPGGSLTLYEYPSAPKTLTAYEIYDKKSDDRVDYARESLHGRFAKYPGNLESRVSPNGRYLAGRPEDYTSDGYDSILIADRVAGSSFRVKTVRKPLDSPIRAWSKDGTRILLNVNKKIKKDWVTVGFAVVEVGAGDLAQSKVGVVNVADDSIRGSDFAWDGNEQGVAIVYGKDEGLRFFDASGKRTRDLPGVGSLQSDARDIFSPSGRTFATECPQGRDGETCLWDTATGRQIRKFSSDCDKVLGWYDETRLYCWEWDNGTNTELQVMDFDGKLVRRLLEVPQELKVTAYFTDNPPNGS
ncbi:protein kinase domain-containing protein [Nonomuraea helvata]|uniref:Protein kinase n=1 Tax=Nonomuraea helvata TaxID=37484 RepID=A0ABV5S4E6_9ACTN